MVHAQSIVETLLELTRQMKTTEDLDDLLLSVSDAALDILPGDHSSLRILNTDGDRLLCAARSGDGVFRGSPVSFRRGEGVIGWVVEHGASAQVDDTAADPRFVEKGAQGFGIGSLVAVPVWAEGEVVGVLSVAARASNEFSDDDLVLAELLANCAVPHIVRARRMRLMSRVMDIISD